MSTQDNNFGQQPFEEIPNISDVFNLGKLIFIIKKSVPWLFLILVIFLLSAFFYLRYSKPVYEASAILKLDTKSSASILNLELGEFSRGIDHQLEGEIELLRSALVYSAALENLNTKVSYYSVGEILDDEKFPRGPFRVELLDDSLPIQGKEIHVTIIDESKYLLSYEIQQQKIEKEYRFGHKVNDGFVKIIIHKEEEFPQGQSHFFFIVNSSASLMQGLSRNLAVSIINPNAKTIGISFTSTNKDKAVAMADAIVKSYLVITKQQKNQTYEQSLDYLERQINMTRDTLNVYDSIISLESGEELLSFFAEDNMSIVSEVKNIRAKQIELQGKLLKTEMLNNLIKADSSYETISYMAEVIGMSEISTKIEEIITLQEEVDRINKSYKESVKKELINDNVNREKLKFISRMQFAISQMKSELRGYEKEILNLKRKLSPKEKETISAELKKLNRYFETYEGVYQELLNKRIEIGIAKASTVPSFQVLAQPSVSPIPIYPIPKNIYIVSFIGFVFTALLLIAVLYFAQNKINSISELSKIIQAPVLGIVPKYKKQQMLHSQLIVHRNPKSSITEALRSIRTNLDFINADQKDTKKIISVTSTISGEGKTFVALNLAGVIALTNKKVVILDLDLRKPKIHFGFGVDNSIGVTSILIGKNSIEECVRDSEIENLQFITSGPLPPNPSEILMSKSFAKFMSDLKDRYDVIVFDTPPVGLVTDGVIIMGHATHPIYVLRAEYSKLSFANNLNKLISNHGYTNLSAVLNSVTAGNTYGGYDSFGYGYGYGYGGNGYYDEEEKSNTLFDRLKTLFKKS